MTASNEELIPAQSRAARALLAWSQRDLARRARLGASTIADFERGQRAPTPDSISLIREALQNGGVVFTTGGVALAEETISMPLRVGGSPDRYIDATDLGDWADRRAGQDGLPELLSQLVTAALGAGARIRSPSADSVQHPGWDAICETETPMGPIPAGVSAWEIGAQRSAIRRKADADYEHRCRDPGGLNPRDTTFVFLTPRRWPGKIAWAAAKREEGFWRDVVVLDADDLVHWIERYPKVGHWLAVRIGKRPAGVRDLPELWSQWAGATLTPLTTDIILLGRDVEAATVHKWLRANSEVISVQAGSVEEAKAFLYACMNELPEPYRGAFLARTLAPADAAGALRLADGVTPLILVIESSEEGFPHALASKGHLVFVAFGSSADAPLEVLRLPSARRSLMEAALQQIGVERHAAQNWARDCLGSLTVLRRLMPPAPGRRPSWSLSAPSPALRAALLAGGWWDESEADRAVLQRLAGAPYANVARILGAHLVEIDGPVRRAGEAWKLASPRDAWVLLAPFLSESDIAVFLEVFHEVVGEPDPLFDVPSDKRWLADGREAGRRHSGLLRRGLEETLILLALFGWQASQVTAAEAKVDAAVRQLFNGADERLWWSLSTEFQRLAEAAPTAFIDSLRKALEPNPSPVEIVFQDDTDGFASREHLSDLLWGLERLAWSPELLPEVTDVLAALDERDPGGRYQNRPRNTLRQIFLLWCPETSASLSRRLEAIDALRRRRNAQAWALMLAIVPRDHDTASPNEHPQWRDFSVDEPEVVTYPLIARGAQAIADRLLEDVGDNVHRWTNLIEIMGNFQPETRQKMAAQLHASISEINDPAGRAMLRDSLRRLLHRHRQFADADWALPEQDLTDFDRAYQALEPDDPVRRVAWIFCPGAVAPDRVAENALYSPDYQGQARVEAIADLYAAAGAEGVIRLVEAAGYPGLVGQAVAQAPQLEALVDPLLEQALKAQTPTMTEMARVLMGYAQLKRGRAWLEAWSERAQAQAWPEEAVLQILHALPADRATWGRVGRAGSEIEQKYWASLGIHQLGGSVAEKSWALRQIMSAGRYRRACVFIGSRIAEGYAVELMIEALTGAARDEDPAFLGGNDATMFNWAIEQMFRALDANPDVPRDKLVSLEWAYFLALKFSSWPAPNVQRALSTDPNFFVSILCMIYVPSPDSGVVDPEPPDEKRAAEFASHAWTLLREWKRVPGSDEAGRIDGEALSRWVRAARTGCMARGRQEVGDQKIGDILAASQAGEDGVWPPAQVRDVIEEAKSGELETGILIGLINRRGVTVRMPDDGGGQERALAARYRKDAKATALDWPRTAALLERIARSYEEDARREDEAAERRQW
jgi:transcriptional regulator with XRE-family HTH domain